MSFQIGRVVCGRYEVMGVLPPPAFGELYRAHAPELKSDVSLLVLGRQLLPDAAARQDLMSRVALARGLRQPNLVWLHDVRLEDDQVVVCTQWAGVDTLRARIEKRKFERHGWPLSADEAWGILQQIAFAVVQMHRDAEVLGDLRADTLMVTPEGLKLFNHGVGCALPRDRFIDALERAGEEMFVAPEVRNGSAPTVRSDVFSLAAIMHELVFGESPSVNPPYLAERAATRPLLAAVLKRALHPEPFERPLSVDALLREIQPTLSEPEQKPAETAPAKHPSLGGSDPPNANKTMIGEVKLPSVGGIDIEAAVARAKAAAASGMTPSPENWGGKNEAVTRQLDVDEVDSLLGKNETRQIELNEIESLLLKAKDPELEAKEKARVQNQPKPEAPRPQLFTAPADPEPILLQAPMPSLRPEEQRTGQMTPVEYGGQFAGSAPPPMWEDVKSKIERQERGGQGRGSGLFIAVAAVVALLVAGAGYLFISGKWVDVAKLVGISVAPAPPLLQPKIEPPKPEAPKPEAPKVAVPPADPCPAGSVLVEGKKRVCIDAYEYPGEGQLPRVQVSFVEAVQLCGARSARLCSEGEWQHACRGPSNSAYPYGAAFSAGKCNSKGSGGKLVPTGSVAGCKSAAGAYDMSGNAAEWVILDAQQLPAIKGGSALAGDPDSGCGAKLEAKTLAGGPFVGFRCCRDLEK